MKERLQPNFFSIHEGLLLHKIIANPLGLGYPPPYCPSWRAAPWADHFFYTVSFSRQYRFFYFKWFVCVSKALSLHLWNQKRLPGIANVKVLIFELQIVITNCWIIFNVRLPITAKYSGNEYLETNYFCLSLWKICLLFT